MTTEMTCDEAEIAILQRQHGALDPAGGDAARLETHLAGCESCRRFERNSAEMERAMQDRVIDELKRIDWTRVETRMAKLRAEERTVLPRAIAMGAVLVVVIAWANGGPTLASYLQQAAWAALFAAALTFFLWAAMRRRVREVEAAQRSPLELVVFYRTQIERAITRTAAGAVFLPLMAAVWIAAGVRAAAHAPKDAALWIGMGVFTLGWTFFVARDWRRLTAEKRELA